MKTPPKLDRDPQPQEPRHDAPSVAQSAEPPPPPGVELPKIYGDGPPRAGPFERSSVWTVHGEQGPVRHDIPCDSLQFPELQAVLRALFAGSAPAVVAHAGSHGAREKLRIEWREHGSLLAVSILFADGTLIREQNGKATVERQLSREALEALEVEIERAALPSPGKRWCAPRA